MRPEPPLLIINRSLTRSPSKSIHRVATCKNSCRSTARIVDVHQRRKIYRALADSDAAKHGMIRVIDESGEDYLYPKELFADIQLGARLAKALDASA